MKTDYWKLKSDVLGKLFRLHTKFPGNWDSLLLLTIVNVGMDRWYPQIFPKNLNFLIIFPFTHFLMFFNDFSVRNSSYFDTTDTTWTTDTQKQFISCFYTSNEINFFFFAFIMIFLFVILYGFTFDNIRLKIFCIFLKKYFGWNIDAAAVLGQHRKLYWFCWCGFWKPYLIMQLQ